MMFEIPTMNVQTERISKPIVGLDRELMFFHFEDFLCLNSCKLEYISQQIVKMSKNYFLLIIF